MNYRCSSRRGVASIIGGVFLVMIIVSGFTFILLSNKTTSNRDSVMRKTAALDADMSRERISVLSVLPYVEGLEKGIVLTVANIGSEILTIKYLGEINENVAYDQYSFIELQKVVGVDPDIRIGSYNVYKIPIKDFNEDGKYVIKLITGKGNIFTTSYPYYGITPYTASTITSLTVFPTSGDPGIQVLVSGSGYTPNSAVFVQWDQAPVDTIPVSIVTDGIGSFSASIRIPVTASYGGHSILAVDTTQRVASQTFTVPPRLVINSIGNNKVTVKGSGFDISHEITITWDGEYPSTATTDVSGSFTVEIDINDLTEGLYLVMAHDGSNIALEYFYVEK